MQIGRRIYYDNSTGYVIQDTGERSGDVVETTIEHDFAVYTELAERVPETISVIELEYGQYGDELNTCITYRVDVDNPPPTLIFTFQGGVFSK